MTVSAVKTDDRTWVIQLGERFDFGCVEDFRMSYESIPLDSRLDVRIDFRSTRYMDSSALGMLINAKNHLSSQGDNKVSLFNCNSQIKKIFSISKFEKKFNIE